MKNSKPTNDDMIVVQNGSLFFHGSIFSCALGKNGLTANKKEGDKKTPVGTFPLKRVFYRADKVSPPLTALDVCVIEKDDIWCDDPKNSSYNTLQKSPVSYSYENMWRDDDIYDIVVELGINDNPPVPGKGSAVFLHIARPNMTPTDGCVAVSLTDMYQILKCSNKSTKIKII